MGSPVETLALSHRPATFEDLIGQNAVTVVLRQMVARQQVPTALLFKGSRGTGKTSTARILAAALNCETPPGPCGHCVSCKSVYTGTSLDLIEVDAASNGLVENIRDLRQQVLYATVGRFRVVVLDEAHSMSVAAGNALLKTLEEPPLGTVFILATTEPARIPDTIASRCTPFAFHRISPADITARLGDISAREKITVEPGLLALLAERADGAMRDAIMILDQLRRADILTVAAYRDLTGDLDYAPGLLAAILTGNTAHAMSALDQVITRIGDVRAIAATLTGVLRDLLILHSGGPLPHTGTGAQLRSELARRLTSIQVFSALKVLWDLATRVTNNQTERTNLELAVMIILERLAPPVLSPGASGPAPPAKLTLAQMAAAR
jgi:DNA polymerase-3 subunit gamma/tau